MKAAAFFVLASTLAIAVAPSDRAAREISSVPLPEGVVRVVALGRAHAAADLVWMKTVQMIGSDTLQARGYPHLDDWIDISTRLDPNFELPYFFGAILLVTDDTRAERVDALLARGELTMPGTFALPMYRGFLAYFGRLDAKTAAGHYRRAAAMEGAPVYLSSFADRIESEAETCQGVMRDLQQLQETMAGAQGRALVGERGKVLVHCLRTQIERAATSWRVKHDDRPPTLEQLITDGVLEPPPSPPGSCWQLSTSQKASLVPCPAPAGGTP